MNFTPVDLFGGAMSADLPVGFVDVSSIRQVPDNQEVYIDANGLTSIIFDITERVDEATTRTDEDAVRYHFQDIVSVAADETRFWQSAVATLSRMPSTPAYVLFATQHPPAQARAQARAQAQARKPQPDFTGILMTVVRLVEQKTDIVVTVNVPHVPGEYRKEDVDLPAQKVGPLLDAATAMRQRILETFEIRDWSLFVNDG